MRPEGQWHSTTVLIKAPLAPADTPMNDIEPSASTYAFKGRHRLLLLWETHDIV